MSTRSYIGIREKDGTFNLVYCHWDGYIGWNGNVLYNHYKSEGKIRKLLAMGNMSCLGEEIGGNDPIDEEDNGKYCIFYHRDKGESFASPTHLPKMSGKSLVKWLFNDTWGEYIYVFDVATQKWYVNNAKNNAMVTLKYRISKEKNKKV